MKRTNKVRTIGATVLVTIAAVFLTIISTNYVAQAQDANPAATIHTDGQPQITNTYAAKFICGVQRDTTVSAIPYPDVQAGRYSTKVNLHNNTGLSINFRKKIIRLLGNQSQKFELPTDPTFKVNESLREDQAMEVVCRDIYKYLNINPVPPDPWPYVEGFVIFEVFYNPDNQPKPPPDPLDVVGVYTYKGDLQGTPTTPASGSGVSIEVVVYPVKNNAHILH